MVLFLRMLTILSLEVVMKKILLIILFLFLVLYDVFTYAHIIQNELSKNVIRLHVVANSDTQVDQELKLKVRDSILEFMKNNNFENLEVAYNSLANSLEKMQSFQAFTSLKKIMIHYHFQLEITQH